MSQEGNQASDPSTSLWNDDDKDDTTGTVDQSTNPPPPPETPSTRGNRLIDLVEFFSGIGGMRQGLEHAVSVATKKTNESTTMDTERDTPTPTVLRSCHAYEISQQANAVYRRNFEPNDDDDDDDDDNDSTHPDTSSKKLQCQVHTKLVEQLTPQTLPRNVTTGTTLWTMSPPCQPFTRSGKRLDCDDKRCYGLFGILRLLRQLDDTRKPQWILLENVQGFETSRMLQQHVYDCLRENHYTWKEYLLCPTQLGIPNHRLRYYLLCERSERFRATTRSGKTRECCTRVPVLTSTTTTATRNGREEGVTPSTTRPLACYLESLSMEQSRPYLVPDKVLRQDWSRDLSITTGSSTRTYCFTAGYSRILHKSTGSLVLVDHSDHTGDDHVTKDKNNNVTKESLSNDNNDNNNNNNNDDDMLRYSNQVRRFSPRELLNLFGFPQTFDFPADKISLEHQYKLIGNSVNVSVVALLLHELLFGNEHVE